MSNPSVPNCSKCDRPMVTCIAQTGSKTGNTFWGCTKFPKCYGTLSYNLSADVETLSGDSISPTSADSHQAGKTQDVETLSGDNISFHTVEAIQDASEKPTDTDLSVSDASSDPPRTQNTVGRSIKTGASVKFKGMFDKEAKEYAPNNAPPAALLSTGTA